MTNTEPDVTQQGYSESDYANERFAQWLYEQSLHHRSQAIAEINILGALLAALVFGWVARIRLLEMPLNQGQWWLDVCGHVLYGLSGIVIAASVVYLFRVFFLGHWGASMQWKARAASLPPRFRAIGLQRQHQVLSGDVYKLLHHRQRILILMSIAVASLFLGLLLLSQVHEVTPNGT